MEFNTNSPQSDLLWSPLFCPFKRVFLRKAHKGRHLARQMWITEAWPLPAMSPLGPGWGPESRPVSFGVFSPVKRTVLPQRGRHEGSQCDRCRLQAGHCTDATDALEQGYPRLPACKQQQQQPGCFPRWKLTFLHPVHWMQTRYFLLCNLHGPQG